jgi:hypothetical protein
MEHLLLDLEAEEIALEEQSRGSLGSPCLLWPSHTRDVDMVLTVDVVYREWAMDRVHRMRGPNRLCFSSSLQLPPPREGLLAGETEQNGLRPKRPKSRCSPCHQ